MLFPLYDDQFISGHNCMVVCICKWNVIVNGFFLCLSIDAGCTLCAVFSSFDITLTAKPIVKNV